MATESPLERTPKPWHADFYELTIGGTMCQIRNEKGYLVAHVHECPDQKGNATLIAASPDLLEACEDMLKAIEYAGTRLVGKEFEAKEKMVKAVRWARNL